MDAFVILVAASASCWGFLGYKLEGDAKAMVYLDGVKHAVFDLADKRHEAEVSTHIGPMRLEVGDGSVRILKSPCPNHLCMKSGAARYVHSEIICVPARLLIVVEGKGIGELDVITY